MLNELIELSKEQVEKLEDRDFLKWMIEELSNEELAMLLFITKTEENVKSLIKLPTPFLQNKVLAKTVRAKLRSMELIPPFPFYIDAFKEGKLTSKEEIITFAEENDCDNRKTALILYLQNHYDESLQYYEKKHEEPVQKKIKKEETVKEEVEEKPGTSIKIENKLQLKIEKLTKEKDELIARNNKLKNELKEKNTEFLKELNQVRQALANEKKITTDYEEQLKSFKLEVQKLQMENEKLQKENETAVETISSTPRVKEKVAMIGNPKNSRILENEKFYISIFELEELPDLIREADQYAYIFYLSYIMDEAIYEETVPETIRKDIKRIETFMQLKEVMGEISHV